MSPILLSNVKVSGSTVLGGTILQHGRLLLRLTAPPEDSALSQIITAIEHDIGHKSAYARAVHPVVSWFVPLILNDWDACVFY